MNKSKSGYAALLVLLIIALLWTFINSLHCQTRVKIQQFKMDWCQFFTEPYEKLIFVYKDQTGIIFHTYDEYKVSLSPGYMLEKIKELDGKTIKDVATIIHNHPFPISFTIGNNYVFHYFKSRGFDGYFMIFYPYSKETRKKGKKNAG